MYKIKKKTPKPEKAPVLYNIIEDYSEFDPPGNVTACATTQPEDVPAHARILSESYDIPLDEMTRLLTEGGVYVYPASGPLITRGLFACRVDSAGSAPKQTWVLDVEQYADAEQLAQSYRLPLKEAAARVFYRTLPPDLKTRLEQGTFGPTAENAEPSVVKGSRTVTYVDFRKDWSPHFKRMCVMPDGRLIETGGVDEFASLHGISVGQARALIRDGGVLEVGSEVLACQIVNGQPSVARFSAANYSKAKAIVAAKQIHIMDALSEVALGDPAMTRALKQMEAGLSRPPTAKFRPTR